MFRKTWPLIAYTLFAQLSVGLCLFPAMQAFSPAAGSAADAASELSAAIVLVSAAGLAVGLLLSFFHLGSPLRAYRALTKINSSWLSREILFSVLFFGALLACYATSRDGRMPPPLIAAAALLGFLLVVSMATAYNTTGRAGWAGPHTYVLFIVSTVVLGAVGSAVVALSLGTTGVLPVGTFKAVLVLAMAALVVGIGTVFSSLPVKAPVTAPGIAQGRKNMIAGAIVSMIGVLVAYFVVATWRVDAFLPIVALVLLLAGEGISRYGFLSMGYPRDLFET